MAESHGAAVGSWKPLRPHEALPLFTPLRVPWWVAGGWALDLFSGSVSRPHKDLDIGIRRRDVSHVLSALPDWHFVEARAGTLSLLDSGETPRADVNSLWVRPAGTTPWAFELMLDDADEHCWIFRRLPAIRMPLALAIRRSPDGIPYLAPEIQLLYKAKAPRAEDQLDFDRVAPRLGGARAWLRNALARIHPEHAWLTAL